MRTNIILAILLILGGSLSAQILNPVKWSFSSKQVSDKEFDLVFTANIQDGWNIYSQYLERNDGPIPTSFNFSKGAHFVTKGKTEESKENRKSEHDDIFDMVLTKYSKKATFTQRVVVNDFSKPVEGYLEFMTCDDHRCLPPTEVGFSFSPTSKSKTSGESSQASKAPAAKVEPPSQATSPEKSLTFLPAISLSDGITPGEGILDPVKWEGAVSNTAGNEYKLELKATIDKGWYLYSQFIEPGGPEPTLIALNPGSRAIFKETAKEVSHYKIDGRDPIFKMRIAKFKNEVKFVQRIISNDPEHPVTGYVSYMVCDDEQCLPAVEVPFSINLNELKVQVGHQEDTAAVVVAENKDGFVIDRSKVSDCGGAPAEEEGKGLWGIFILGFLGGLVALLTPCVFPMIPLTVSYFTKGAENKRKGLFNAFMYGFFIFAVYLLLSIPFHMLDSVNPDILNEISTNVWLNIFFFVIFLVFAFSFFGYFELTLPSSWANKASSAEGIGGIVGIFFMALTLALVSFSCTGPILGSLLAGALSSDGGAMQLTAGMGGFGVALALPFGLFAAFPSWLNTLPKSGGWMTTVKVVLGFLELALALKFLSNADLVKHWGLLKVEPFLALWIIIFAAMGFYLLGKIRFPHDTPVKKLGTGRLITALLSFGFAIYLATGFIYDNNSKSFRSLKLLSGLAPPTGYSWIYPKDCPQNLDCFKDFDAGLAYAKKMNKPIMLDFTGHACVNCRKMEEHVWPVKSVYSLLKNEYVLISLYVDEKIDLPAEEQVIVPMKTGGTRKMRTTGHKWQHFQTEHFNTNAQPYYVLLSPDGTLLAEPVGYMPDAAEYANFLQCGLTNFKSLNTENNLLGDK